MTELPGTPSASAVSRFLAEHFTRSERVGRGPDGYSIGFTVRKALGSEFRPVDWVVVEFEFGYHLRSRMYGRADLLLKNTQKVLVKLEERLVDRYDVSRNDEDGPDEWNCLLVRKEKENEG